MSSKADPSTDGRAIRGEATRRRIVDAARDVLLERGHAGASTRAVADEAGVRLSLVHYHFGGKHGLLLEVLERENELLLQRQQKLYAAPGPLADKWRTACEFLEEDIHSGYVRVLWELWAAGLADEDLAAGWRSAMGGWRRLLESVFAELGRGARDRAAALAARARHARGQPLRGHRDRAARRRARAGRAARRGARSDRRAHRARRVQALTCRRRAMDSAAGPDLISHELHTNEPQGGDPLGRRPDRRRLADGGARHARRGDGAEHDPPRPRRLGRAAGVDGQRLQPQLRRAADDRRGARRPLRPAQPLRRRPGALRRCRRRPARWRPTSAG